MLKKNPNCVETIKRLRRYIGNCKNWELSDEEKKAFSENAEKIREHADTIYNIFKVSVSSLDLFTVRNRNSEFAFKTLNIRVLCRRKVTQKQPFHYPHFW